VEKIDLPGMKVPASITFDGHNLYVDGVAIALSAIPQVLYEYAHPDPRKWYRFERMGDTIFVHVRISEDSDGSVIASSASGRSSEDSGQQGQAAQAP
jgi:hypothetical protein